MTCYMPNDLSVCVSAGRAIFLDVARDRYFRLRPAQDAAIRALICGQEAHKDQLEALRVRGILVDKARNTRPLAALQATPPRRSLIEDHDAQARRPALRLLPEATLSLALAQWRLKRTGFKGTLEKLAMRKQCTNDAGPAPADETHALAKAFDSTCRLVPVNAICLRDSIALLECLFRRNMTASLVIGVKAQPFAAHCWVQREDVVLNCALEYAAMFTPIRAI